MYGPVPRYGNPVDYGPMPTWSPPADGLILYREPKPRRWVVIVVVVGLLGLVGAGLGLGWAAANRPESFHDVKNRLTLTAPQTWDGYASGAGVDGPATPAEQQQGYEAQDLLLVSFLADDKVYAFIDATKPTGVLKDDQAGWLTFLCGDHRCVDKGKAEPVTVAGNPGLRQRVVAQGEMWTVETVHTPTMQVRLAGVRTTDDNAADLSSLNRILDSATFSS